MAWLTSEQALAALGTKPQSLYASVSRGRIRMKPDPKDSRKSLYGRDAAALAETATLEDIAALLWESENVDFSLLPGGALARASSIAPLRRGFAVIADRAATDAPALGRSLPVLRAEANGIVAALAVGLGATAQNGPLHERLADAWQRPEAADAIRRI